MTDYPSSCYCRDLDSIAKVGIDPDGEFKYILMLVKCMNKKHELPSVTIVRGYKRYNTHTDIFDHVRDVEILLENKTLLQLILKIKEFVINTMRTHGPIFQLLIVRFQPCWLYRQKHRNNLSLPTMS